MLLECKYSAFGVFDEGVTIGPARWVYYDLLFVHDGHIVLWPEVSRRTELKAGQSILIYPDTEFDGYSTVDGSRLSVEHFSIVDGHGLPEEIARLAGRKDGFETFLNIPDRQVERDIERLVNLKQSEQPCRLDSEVMSSIMLLILLGVLQAREGFRCGGGDTFDELLDYMEENICRNVSLEDMADVCGLSVSHFRALFRQRFHQSPGNYFRKLRMNMIAKRLRETTMPVKEIAAKSGFDMLPNFYRAFRAVYGTSPIEYRRRNTPKG